MSSPPPEVGEVAPVGPVRLLARLSALRWDWAWVFAGSTLVAILGVVVGQAYVPAASARVRGEAPIITAFVRWDGTYYRDIATHGYVYRPGQSVVHFPPAYPLAARAVRAVTGLSVEWAMVLTAHLCFLAALAVLADYTGRRYGADARPAALVAAGFFPAGVFFHLGYAESLLLLVCVGVLWLIDRGYHPLLVAGVAAIGLVTRFVGVALVLPVLMYAWQYGRDGWRSAWWVAVCSLVTFAGLAALMYYFDTVFGDPILFARGRDDLWRMREALPLGEKVVTLLTLRPVWEVFDPGSSAYWGQRSRSDAEALFALYPANPVVFVLALGLAGWGMWAGLLDRYGAALTVGLLAIPYWVGGYDMNMVSMARYVSVIVPLYPVAGVLLARWGPAGLAGFAGCGAVLMAAYAARFAQGHWII